MGLFLFALGELVCFKIQDLKQNKFSLQSVKICVVYNKKIKENVFLPCVLTK